MGTTPLRTAVLISGGGTNLQAIIDATRAGQLPIELCGVLSDRGGAAGLVRARRSDIPARAIEFRDYAKRGDAERDLDSALRELRPDLVVLAGFMRILPAEIVSRWTGRMLNVHPSLLPKFRGLNTYRRALEAGERWHGSTVHFVIPELDAGPSIVQYRVAVRPHDTETTLRARVQRGEYQIYPLAIAWFANGRIEYRDDDVFLDGDRLDAPVVVDEQDSEP